MLDNVGLRYPHRASGAKAPRTLRPLPLLRFAVFATGGAHLCSIQYYLRFWLSICRTSLAVSALRIMRYCPYHLQQTLQITCRGRCLPSSRGPICIAAFKIVSCRTLRWWCGPQAGPNARHHNYSQILRVFPKNLLTIPAVLCDNRIIEQLPNRKSLCKTRNQHDASPTYFRETLHPVWYPTPPKLNEWPHIPGKIVGAKHSFY